MNRSKNGSAEPAGRTQPSPSWWGPIESALCSVRFWWILGLAYAAIFAWNSRHWMNPDGLNYLDLASAAVKGGPSQLVDGLWSPGFPALIALGLLLFRPGPGTEFALVHLVTFLLFVFSLWGFSVFFREWRAAAFGIGAGSGGVERALIPFAYGAFLWFDLHLVGVENLTPDLGVNACVFLAAAIACRLSRAGTGTKQNMALGAALGLVLGIGYYFKAVMMPMGVVLLPILFFLRPRSRSQESGARESGLRGGASLLAPLSLALVVMLLLAAPLVAALSRRAGALDFSDAGTLNYLWHVNKLTPADIQQNAPGIGARHPIPVLTTTPLTWDLRGPVKSTYPLYYRPTYWWAGVHERIRLHQQIAELGESLAVYKELVLSDTMPFFAGLIVLGCLGAVAGARSCPAKVAWWQIAWPLVACALYAVVHTEPRYVSPFLALLFVASYPVLACRVSRQAAAAVYATVLLTVMIPLTVHLANVCVDTARDLAHPSPPAYEPAAAGLRELGLKPGDGIAMVGQAFDIYYARYDRLRVIAQIPSQDQFWRLSAPQLKSLSERLAAIGVKAIIASGRPRVYPAADWRVVPGSDQRELDVLTLSPAESVSR